MVEVDVPVELLSVRDAPRDHELAPGIDVRLDPPVPGDEREKREDRIGEEDRKSPFQARPRRARFDGTARTAAAGAAAGAWKPASDPTQGIVAHPVARLRG